MTQLSKNLLITNIITVILVIFLVINFEIQRTEKKELLEQQTELLTDNLETTIRLRNTLEIALRSTRLLNVCLDELENQKSNIDFNVHNFDTDDVQKFLE